MAMTLQLLPVLQKHFNGSTKAVLLHTVKGKGIPEFEHDPAWHARKIKGKLEIGNDFGIYEKTLWSYPSGTS